MAKIRREIVEAEGRFQTELDRAPRRAGRGRTDVQHREPMKKGGKIQEDRVSLDVTIIFRGTRESDNTWCLSLLPFPRSNIKTVETKH
jgi:hypothetical protein